MNWVDGGRLAPKPTDVGAPSPSDQAAEGVEGNARITAANGLVLTVLLAVEGLTILRIRQLITLHIFLGLMLAAPIALKIVTTTYRFARYYLRDEAYVRRGPPPAWLRVLGPLLVAATIAVMATGIILLLRQPDSPGPWLQLHKISFIGWVALMTLHFLGHFAESVRLSIRDWRPQSSASARGRGSRTVALMLSLAIGVGVAAAFTPGNAWSGSRLGHEHRLAIRTHRP